MAGISVRRELDKCVTTGAVIIRPRFAVSTKMSAAGVMLRAVSTEDPTDEMEFLLTRDEAVDLGMALVRARCDG